MASKASCGEASTSVSNLISTYLWAGTALSVFQFLSYIELDTISGP